MVRLLSIFLLLLAGSVSAENLLKNGSFECGVSGWNARMSAESTGFNRPLVVGTGGTDHDYCLHFQPQHVVRSRPIYLTNGHYTVSFKAYRVGSSTSLRTTLNRVSSAQDWGTSRVFAITTTPWGSYNNSWSVTTPDWYVVGFEHYDQNMDVYIDAVQLEPGIGASSYAPRSDMEIGLEVDAPYNMLFSGDDAEADLIWFNDAATEATDKVVYYEIFDVWNNRLTNGFFTNTIAADTREVTAIPLPIYGWQRVTARLTDSDVDDEVLATVFPYAAKSVTEDQGGLFGVNANWSAYSITNLRRAGFTWNRSLSVARTLFSWGNIELADGTYTWDEDAYDIWSTNGLATSASLFHGNESDWRSWMGDSGTGEIYTNDLYLWTLHTVSNYADNIDAWELWNEWGAYTNETPYPYSWWVTNEANYYAMAIPMAEAIRAQDPTAKIASLQEFTVAQNEAFWDLVIAAEKTNLIDVVAGHMYPQDNNEGNDMNSAPSWSTVVGPYHNWNVWRTADAPQQELWNTEAGTWGYPNNRGYESLWYLRPLVNYGTDQYLAQERMIRAPISCARIVQSWVRGFGYGFSKHIYYDARGSQFNSSYVPNVAGSSASHPTLMGHGNRDMKSQAAATMICNNFFEGFSSYGTLTNINESDLEFYIFERYGTNLVVGWSFDRNDHNVTLATANYTVYDMMGNEVSQGANLLRINRWPQYIVNTTDSWSTVSNAIATATVASQSDTNAPYVSVDICPSGTPSGDSVFVKWSANDNRWWNQSYGTDQDLITFSYGVDGQNMTSYSQTNFAWITIPATSTNLWVSAIDTDGNATTNLFWFDPLDSFYDAEEVVEGSGLIFNVNNFNWRN